MMKIQPISVKRIVNVPVSVAVAILFSTISLPQAQADDVPAPSHEPLKGGVEDTNLLPSKQETFKEQIPMAVPVPKKKLDGKLEHADPNPLEGRAQDDGDANLQGMTGQTDKKVLQGSAQQLDGAVGEDPDTTDQELMVEWDAWRNRFLQAVQSDVQSNLNNSDDSMLRWDPRNQTVIRQFPLGTVAWFKCDIREDLKIVNFQLVKSSGYPNYDRIVMDAVAALNGTNILRFPSKSKRHKVNQMAGIQTATQSTKEFFRFGDVEKYRVPSGQ
jgi:hypothetical protein